MKKNQFKRIFVIVADSLGIGEAPEMCIRDRY